MPSSFVPDLDARSSRALPCPSSLHADPIALLPCFRALPQSAAPPEFPSPSGTTTSAGRRRPIHIPARRGTELHPPQRPASPEAAPVLPSNLQPTPAMRMMIFQPLLPYVGMEFDSIEDAKKFYNHYTFGTGFGSRIASSKNSQKKGPQQLIKRVFQCVHAGKPETTCETSSHSEGIAAGGSSSSKQAGVEMDVTAKHQRNRIPLMQHEEIVRFYRSHCKIPEEDYQLLMTMHDVNLSTTNCMGMLGMVHGGDRRKLPCVKRDVSNACSKLRQNQSFQDMDMTVAYFKRRQAENAQFYYTTEVDKETNEVTDLFLVDGRTRALYPKYKDCVFFDTTFCTNRYNLPFAPIVGVNNHLQTVLLGCALVPNEQIETFKWVFQHWMIAMNNEHPLHLMTDQDKAMETTIKDVFPNTVHRCCKWHVQRKAREMLGRILSMDEIFEQVFYGVINDSETVDEFEENWQHMLHCFDLVDNRHLSNMWCTRETWAPAYFRKNFFPFTSTTGRSEGLNSYFKTFVNPQDSVWRFVQQYEVLQETMLDREDNQAFIGHATTAPLYSRYNFERQAVHFYTQSVFLKFQKEVMASTGSIMNMAPALDNASVRFELHSNYFENPRIFSVNVVLAKEKFECSCNCFEMNGIICAHIIRVMVHLNVQKIPQRYMLERWSEVATTAMSSGGCLLDFGHPATNTLKYNALCRKYTWLASQACSNDLAYKIMNDAAHQLEPLVAAAKQGALQEQQEANQQQATHQQQQTPEPTTAPQPDGDAMLQNPARVPKKGRPTEKSKRRKTLLEQREDAHKNKAKKDEKKQTKPRGKPGKKKAPPCSYCNEEGHGVQTCQYLKAAMGVKKCPYCEEQGHAVQECPYLKAAMKTDANMARATELRL
ncbi:protein FAR1-RELATED SEQUENCE 9-like [Triticum urartu]|uniref:protein FAR1-RELATED SEQUENCE 9-like n=1 Tax=Triticum urartu TaxID=4572 RepID=UPI0020449281|nr:protein FAR1-RELATED SEQUENCE 9-like [Triticum urartu]